MKLRIKIIIFLICSGSFLLFNPGISVAATSASEAFIVNLFENLLGREPEEEGLEWWATQIDQGAWSKEQAIWDIAFSPEGMATGVGALTTQEFNENAADLLAFDMSFSNVSGETATIKDKTVGDAILDLQYYALANDVVLNVDSFDEAGFSATCTNGGDVCGGSGCVAAAVDTGPEPEVCDTCDCPGYPSCYVSPTCTPSCGNCSVSCGGGTQTCTDSDCSTYTQSCNTLPCDNGCAATTPIGQICWNGYAWVEGTYNSAPQVSDLTAPNWNFSQAASQALRANLQFSLIDPDAGSFGSAYQLIVKKADGTLVLDTGKCTGYQTPSADCKIDNAICLKNGATGCINPGDCVCQYALDASKLNYDIAYQWWVKVWDNHDLASALTQYSAAADTDNNDGVALTFTTYRHKMPIPSATYLPASPSRGEPVKFTDTSKTFLTAAPTAEVPCDPAKCSWLWTVPEGASINDNATSTPTITFGSAGAMSVTLKVTDLIDGYYSQITMPLNVNADLPTWKEVKPE